MTSFKLHCVPAVTMRPHLASDLEIGKILIQLPLCSFAYSLCKLDGDQWTCRHSTDVDIFGCLLCAEKVYGVFVCIFSSETSWNWRSTDWQPSCCKSWTVYQAPLAKQVRIKQLLCLTGNCNWKVLVLMYTAVF